MALTDPWPDGDDDTDLDYYDTPAGNIWRPVTQSPRRARTRAASRRTGHDGRQRAVNPNRRPEQDHAHDHPTSPLVPELPAAVRLSPRTDAPPARDLPARPPALIRLARALRAVHQELEIASECLLRPIPPPQADPLTWIRTRTGYCLAGRYLPARPGQPTATKSLTPDAPMPDMQA